MKENHFNKPSHLSTPRTERDGCWFAGADPFERDVPEPSSLKAGATWVLVILAALGLAMLFHPLVRP